MGLGVQLQPGKEGVQWRLPGLSCPWPVAYLQVPACLCLPACLLSLQYQGTLALQIDQGPGRASKETNASSNTPSSTTHTPPAKGLSLVTHLLGSLLLLCSSAALGIFNIQPLPPHLPSCSPSISNKFFTRLNFKCLQIFLISFSLYLYIPTTTTLISSNSPSLPTLVVAS